MNRKRLFTYVGGGVAFVAILILLFSACLEIYYSGMTHVEAGQFEMGCADCLDREKPVHTVKLEGFWIDQFEVTNIQYIRFLNEGIANGWITVNEIFRNDGTSYFQAEVDGNRAIVLHPSIPWAQISYTDGAFVTEPSKENLPVTVSWYGAQAYCESFGKRLPTEAEWEYAAKGGQWSRYVPGEVEYYCFSGSDDVNEVAWHRNNSSATAHPVGQKAPNELNIFDMSGNLREWVSDTFDPEYYSNSPEFNPTGPSIEGQKIMRGGSWNEWQLPEEVELDIDPKLCRVTKREYG